jgi:hypothetical protein
LASRIQARIFIFITKKGNSRLDVAAGMAVIFRHTAPKVFSVDAVHARLLVC